MGKKIISCSWRVPITFTDEFVSFDPHLDGIMAHRLQRLIDTGVHFIWEKLIAIRHRTVKQHALENSQKPFKLNSDLFSWFSTIFCLYLFASLIFCMEIVFTLLTLFWEHEMMQFYFIFIHV